ncbi:MAG: hypothetical protein EZS28_023250 [Streblomastix strix]|uniref:Uncharacterized protein n=1 Tax=Streblomastix strix TaxID=222440 RepID=A0A5J4VFL8_9EUKA|nr:MAG: hypothetical protein EZS28_023250 [Streblomastix strix]
MVQKAHQKWIERIRVFYDKRGTLILDVGMMSHIHAVPVYLDHPLISPEPTLLSIYKRLCIVDGLSKLVAQTTLYLQQFKIGVRGVTTDGGSSFKSGLSLFSKQTTLDFFQKAAEQVMDHSEEIKQLGTSRKYNPVKFAPQFYYLTKPLFETTSVLESNTSQVSNVFPLALLGEEIDAIEKPGNDQFYYLVFQINFGSTYYVSEIIPSLPFFDIKSIQIPQKPDKYPEHRILQQKVENAYQLAISQIQITDPTAPCFILVQKIIWNSRVEFPSVQTHFITTR